MELKEGQAALILETKGGSGRGMAEKEEVRRVSRVRSCKASWIGKRSLDFILSVM